MERVRVGHKDHELVAEGGSVQRIDLAGADADARVLNDDEAMKLGRLGLRVEAHYGEPQDVEWAMDADDEIFLVQSRPITAWPAHVDLEARQSAAV